MSLGSRARWGANAMGRRGLRRRRGQSSALESLERRVVLSTVMWTSSQSGFWDVAANWVDNQGVNRVPGPNDDVTIDVTGATPTITIRTAVSVHSLMATDPVIVSPSDSLSLAAASTISGPLSLGRGSVLSNRRSAPRSPGARPGPTRHDRRSRSSGQHGLTDDRRHQMVNPQYLPGQPGDHHRDRAPGPSTLPGGGSAGETLTGKRRSAPQQHRYGGRAAERYVRQSRHDRRGGRDGPDVHERRLGVQ